MAKNTLEKIGIGMVLLIVISMVNETNYINFLSEAGVKIHDHSFLMGIDAVLCILFVHFGTVFFKGMRKKVDWDDIFIYGIYTSTILVYFCFKSYALYSGDMADMVRKSSFYFDYYLANLWLLFLSFAGCGGVFIVFSLIRFFFFSINQKDVEKVDDTSEVTESLRLPFLTKNEELNKKIQSYDTLGVRSHLDTFTIHETDKMIHNLIRAMMHYNVMTDSHEKEECLALIQNMENTLSLRLDEVIQKYNQHHREQIQKLHSLTR